MAHNTQTTETKFPHLDNHLFGIDLSFNKLGENIRKTLIAALEKNTERLKDMGLAPDLVNTFRSNSIDLIKANLGCETEVMEIINGESGKLGLALEVAKEDYKRDFRGILTGNDEEVAV